MAKEDVRHTHTHTHTHTGILLSHQKEENLAICNDMDGARVYYAKQNKSVRERQISDDFTHLWNLRNKTDEHRGKEAKLRKKQRRKNIIRDS